jgi:organic hydroperoxide reductase OsmC/OhrA
MRMAGGKQHHYSVEVRWTGNLGEGTKSYQSYARSHEITSGRKPPIPGSSDPAFRGDGDRWNPEDLMVAAVSACHKLWYLHLCAVAGINVVAYVDHAEGVMTEDAKRGGYFTGVTLRPAVTITADSDVAKAAALHHEAHEKCFIANSVNFAIHCEPSIKREA